MPEQVNNTLQNNVVRRLFDYGLSYIILGAVSYFLYTEVQNTKQEVKQLSSEQKNMLIEQRNLLRDHVDKNTTFLGQAIETNQDVVDALYQFRPMSKYKRL